MDAREEDTDVTPMGHMWVKELGNGYWGAWWERDCQGVPYFTRKGKEAIKMQVALTSNKINAG